MLPLDVFACEDSLTLLGGRIFARPRPESVAMLCALSSNLVAYGMQSWWWGATLCFVVSRWRGELDGGRLEWHSSKGSVFAGEAVVMLGRVGMQQQQRCTVLVTSEHQKTDAFGT